MWSVFSVVAFVSVFESVFTQNHRGNETAQNQTGHDLIGVGAAFARNLSASISVLDDTELVEKRSGSENTTVNITDRVESIGENDPLEKVDNVIEFNSPGKMNVSEKKLDNFRPSPPLETYYEFNRFPVKPAFPEAKTVANLQSTDFIHKDRTPISRGETLPVDNTNFRNPNTFDPGYSAYGNVNYQNYAKGNQHGYSVNTGHPSVAASWQINNNNAQATPWVSRVRFPSGPTQNQNDPYQLATNSPNTPGCCNAEKPSASNVGYNIQNGHRNDLYPSHTEPDKPVHEYTSQYNSPGEYLPPIPTFTSTGRGGELKNRSPAGYGSPRPSEGFDFNRLVEVPKKHYSPESPPYNSHHKTYEPPYNLMEKPAHEIHHKTYDGGYGGGINPWKKILKLLATFIPIGLLISALTPTVITVNSVNDTDMMTTRYRSSDDSKRDLQKHILNSLDYFEKLNENGCEYRVFCELLVTASNMPNSEKHVQNLLDNFAKQDIDYKSRAEHLRKVFEAVRKEDCSPITCEFIKNPT